MHDLALEQIGHRRQADMGMGADIEPLAGAKDRGAELIEEDEGADHPALGRGQHPADLEAVAQILDPGDDRHLDRIRLPRRRSQGAWSWKVTPAGIRGRRQRVWFSAAALAILAAEGERNAMTLETPPGYRPLTEDSLPGWLAGLPDMAARLGGRRVGLEGRRGRRRQSQPRLPGGRPRGRGLRQAGAALCPAGGRGLADDIAARLLRA